LGLQSHPATWRFIDSLPDCGARNMSVDEALLSTFDPVNSLPVFRIYGWSPPALSVGRFQKTTEEIDVHNCRRDGLALVRRITGGGALYHADELTYSIVCSPQQIPESASVKDSFRVLTAFLLDFYRALGLNAAYAVDSTPDAGQLGSRTSFCYAGKESFDILVDGRKMGGNAQRRMKNIVFQHGSIPLRNCTMDGLRYMIDRSPCYAEDSTSLFDCGIATDPVELKLLLVEAFGRRVNAAMLESQLTAGADMLSKKLMTEKYSTNVWNLRGETG
jgi:lipoate-protein ligase A